VSDDVRTESEQSPAETEPAPAADAELTETPEPTDLGELPDEAADSLEEPPVAESATSGRAELLEQLEREGDAAADFLEELLDIADLDGDIDLDVDNDRASVSIVGGDLGVLVGNGGKVLEALQELTRLAVLQDTGERSRLMLDVAGHRAARRAELVQQAGDAASSVRESGESVRLAPMTPFERKVVHDAVAAAGLRSESEGEEPQRRVVVLPAS